MNDTDRYLHALKECCDDLNYNFRIDYWDGDIAITVTDNTETNHGTELEVAEVRGYQIMEDALVEILELI